MSLEGGVSLDMPQDATTGGHRNIESKTAGQQDSKMQQGQTLRTRNKQRQEEKGSSRSDSKVKGRWSCQEEEILPYASIHSTWSYIPGPTNMHIIVIVGIADLNHCQLDWRHFPLRVKIKQRLLFHISSHAVTCHEHEMIPRFRKFSQAVKRAFDHMLHVLL